ncbi:hypothetical protein EV361DRAFT_1032039 [Lentinula raphanica]|nr:hypothetical protein EV361DRAFT_1032039 [Lentinula raphanica]
MSVSGFIELTSSFGRVKTRVFRITLWLRNTSGLGETLDLEYELRRMVLFAKKSRIRPPTIWLIQKSVLRVLSNEIVNCSAWQGCGKGGLHVDRRNKSGREVFNNRPQPHFTTRHRSSHSPTSIVLKVPQKDKLLKGLLPGKFEFVALYGLRLSTKAYAGLHRRPDLTNPIAAKETSVVMVHYPGKVSSERQARVAAALFSRSARRPSRRIDRSSQSSFGEQLVPEAFQDEIVGGRGRLALRRYGEGLLMATSECKLGTKLISD